jgi:hypothetical protein
LRIFAIKPFRKWAQNNDLTDDLLRDAVNEVEKGIVDANLGGNLYKKLIATKGRGKSGSVRTLLVYAADKRTFFMFGFEKADQANISQKEEKALKILGKEYLKFTDAKLATLLKEKVIIEITEGKE